MTPFALSGLLILITGIGSIVLIFIKTPHIYTNRLWAYFNFAIVIWGFGAYKIGSNHTDPEASLLWLKIAHIGVITIPVFFFHFANSFFEVRKKSLIVCVYVIGGFFLITLLTGHLITHTKIFFNSFYYMTNPNLLYKIFFFLWVSSVVYTYLLAFRKIQTTTKINQNKIKYIFLATSIGYVGGITNFFPILGINIYPYGNFLVSIYPILMTYFILKYNLMDINVVIRRSLIYSSLVTIITLLFLISVLISEHLFNQFAQYHNIIFSIIISSIIALIFTPLKNKLQNLIDRAFYKGTTQEIALQNEQLRNEISQTEKYKIASALSSGIAHEIKNPLTSLSIFTEYLPQKKDDPVFLEQYQKVVKEEIGRINNLLQELLDFAKPSEPQMNQINPNDIINQIIHLVQQKCINNKIKIETNLETSSKILADPNQLKQALLNLILNAIDAMPNGGILTIQTSVIASPNALVRTKQSFIINISDTGCGINPKHLPHIFEPFFTKKEKGTGLGLAITHGIIEKHGGKIKVQSKINEGTNFKIIF